MAIYQYFTLFVCCYLVLSTQLLKSQSADSLLNSDMDTAPSQAAPTNLTWLDGLGQRPKDMDTASSAHSTQHSPQTHDAFLSLLTNKGEKTPTVYPYPSINIKKELTSFHFP